MKTLILGHSFVRRLHDEMKENQDDFTVDCAGQIQMLGYGGATVRALRRDHVMTEVLKTKADQIFLQVGGNDINPTINGDRLALDIVTFAKILLKTGAVKVIVGTVFPRLKPRRMEASLYNEIRTDTNRYLAEYLAFEPKVQLWSHRMFCDAIDFHSDGVHLNSMGNSKFKFSIQEALLSNPLTQPWQ